MTPVALVTGGGRGIGRAVAEVLAERDYRIAVVDSDPARCRDLPGWLGVAADVASSGDVEAAVAAVEAELGPVDVLVNNVGIGSPPPNVAEDVDPADWRRVIDVNVNGTFLMSQRVGRTMIARGGGVIVNIASIYGERALDWRLYGTGGDAPRQDDAAYHVSKAAVIQLTRVLAVSWARFGVRVCAISPGPVTTEYVRETSDDVALSQIAGRVPLQRLGSPREIAECVCFLCSDEASFVTGSNVVVDGGWTCW